MRTLRMTKSQPAISTQRKPLHIKLVTNIAAVRFFPIHHWIKEPLILHALLNQTRHFVLSWNGEYYALGVLDAGMLHIRYEAWAVSGYDYSDFSETSPAVL